MKEVSIQSFLLQHYQHKDPSVETLLHEHIAHLKRAEYRKNTFLVRPGFVSQYSFFVEKGLLRYYLIDDKGKEHILYFAPEGWLLSDRESFFFHQPSACYIEALEDSTVVLIDRDFFPRLSAASQQMMQLHEQLLQRHVLQLQKRIVRLLSASAEERYLHFIKIYPDIVMRVPQSMVASYLGIAPESLSRVRKDLATKWKNNEK